MCRGYFVRCIRWLPLAAGLSCCQVAQTVPDRSLDDIDVLIIGAGQAGTAAAHRLAALGKNIRLLEASDYVGGRTRNVDVGTGAFDVATDDVVEVGGTWLSPRHTAALGLCQELGLQVYNASFVDEGVRSTAPLGHGIHVKPMHEEEWPWWFWGSDYSAEQTEHLGRTIFHTSNGSFPFRSPTDLREHLQPMLVNELEIAGAKIHSAAAELGGTCWNATRVTSAWRRFDSDSTAGFLQRQTLAGEAQQFLRNCIHGKNAQEPEAVSFLYNLLSFQGCNSAGPDSQYRVRGGTQAIPLKIAAQLGNRVVLGDPVQSITASPKGVTVRTRRGQLHNAAAAILTGAPAMVLGINFDPPLPGTAAQLLQRMPMGTSMKLAAVYSQGPWWRELGLQGDILSTALPRELSLPEPDASEPMFVQCMDHSPFSRRLGVIVCFLEGRQNMHLTSLPKDQQRALLLSFLRKSFNDSRAETLQPTIIAHNWADQPFARGAYTGFFPPGVMSVPAFWEAYREMEKIPNVFLAGSDYHVGFGNGYIEGAIRSGQHAAERVHMRLMEQMEAQQHQRQEDMKRPSVVV